jgi:hypothetical protein
MSEDNGPGRPEDEPGYWERKAAEEAATPAPPQPQFNPQTGYPAGQQPPAPPPYPTPGQPPATPYGGPVPPGQPGWYAPPGTQPYPVYVRPDLPKATAAMVVGIIALAGTFTCGLPILASPVAWVLGAQARRQIREAPQQWGGESKATAGMVLGIIGTVLLALALIAIVVVIIVAINDPNAFDDSSTV